MRRTAALAAAFLLLCAAGCGRKAKPEPRQASLSAAAHYVVCEVTECTISR